MSFSGFTKPVSWLSKFVESQSNFNNASFVGKLGSGTYHGLKHGYNLGIRGGGIFAAGFAGYAFATAPRGKAVAKGTASLLGASTASMIAGLAGGLIAGPVGGMVGALAGQFLMVSPLERMIEKPVQAFVDLGYHARHVNFGGDYRDTDQAITMRQAAAREMSGSLLNARRWMGSEALFMHS